MESPEKKVLVVPANTARLFEELVQRSSRIQVRKEPDLDRSNQGSAAKEK